VSHSVCELSHNVVIDRRHVIRDRAAAELGSEVLFSSAAVALSQSSAIAALFRTPPDPKNDRTLLCGGHQNLPAKAQFPVCEIRQTMRALTLGTDAYGVIGLDVDGVRDAIGGELWRCVTEEHFGEALQIALWSPPQSGMRLSANVQARFGLRPLRRRVEQLVRQIGIH
jgi:hypothetical protein